MSRMLWKFQLSNNAKSSSTPQPYRLSHNSHNITLRVISIIIIVVHRLALDWHTHPITDLKNSLCAMSVPPVYARFIAPCRHVTRFQSVLISLRHHTMECAAHISTVSITAPHNVMLISRTQSKLAHSQKKREKPQHNEQEKLILPGVRNRKISLPQQCAKGEMKWKWNERERQQREISIVGVKKDWQNKAARRRARTTVENENVSSFMIRALASSPSSRFRN